jgi:hypothetical protein
MVLPHSVEALERAWEKLDRLRAYWEVALGRPWPSLEDQFAAIERADREARGGGDITG